MLLIIWLLVFPAELSIGQNDQEEILLTLENQRNCWNQGNLECFMKSYWQSDSLVFIGKNGPKYGWKTTLENYKKGYPNQEAMGKLDFKVLQLNRITDNYYFMIGKWSLKREVANLQNLEGHFTLLWKKLNNRWLIIADHSS